jgi:predicted flap endonuclease-1-like 5' DNA nuclease
MGLIDRLKSALGLGSSGSSTTDRTTTASTDSGRVGVNVEHEPSSETEAEPASEPEAEPKPNTTSEDAVKGTAPSDAADAGSTDRTAEPIDSIKGIGPTYADRLAAVGIETVADLADADPQRIAEETDISETRVSNWVERAKNR